MNLTKTIFLLSMLSVLAFSGCKQYDEDSFITLKSVKNRLLDKNWTLESLTINGADSTKRYNSKGFLLVCKDVGSQFSNTFTYSLSYTLNSTYTSATGYFSMPNHGDYFQFDSFNYANTSSYSYSYSTFAPSYIFDLNSQTTTPTPWKITKLDSDEFHLQTTISDYNNQNVYGSYNIIMKLKVN